MSEVVSLYDTFPLTDIINIVFFALVLWLFRKYSNMVDAGAKRESNYVILIQQQNDIIISFGKELTGIRKSMDDYNVTITRLFDEISKKSGVNDE